MNTKRLTELRKQKGLTREEMASKIGVSKFTYRSYEQGLRQPSIGVLIRMSINYHCRTDELI